MARDEFEAIRTAKRNAKARLFAIPGVHAVGIGPKRVGDQPSKELAIIVYVVRKRSVEEIPVEQRIPKEIEGFPTDVVQSGIPSLSVADDPDKVNDTSRHRPVLGGVQIQGAVNRYFGTLGFLAVMNESPNAEVVAVTNWHVIAAGTGTDPNLTLTSVSAPGKVTVTLAPNGTAPIPVGSVVYFNFTVTGVPSGYDFYAHSLSGDTPTTLIGRLLQEINTLAVPGIQASFPGPTPGPSIIITVPATATGYETDVYGPTRPDPNAELHATTSNNTVTFSGAVNDERYGVLAAVNFSSSEHATTGFFLSISKGQTPATVATRFAAAYEELNPLFVATVTGTQVTLSPASQLDVFVWRDIRAGQPSNNLATGCCDCCPDDVGPTLAADYGLDAAMILVDSNRIEKYLAEVKGIGYIVGSHSVTPAEVVAGFAVVKRGRTTGVRNGTVEAIDVDGIIAPDFEVPNPNPKLDPVERWYSPRKYDGAMRITSTTSATTDFSDSGDSGSAILHAAGGGYQVVGLLFGGEKPTATSPPGTRPHTLATPIQPILDRFEIVVATATGLDQEKAVPASMGARRAKATTLEGREIPAHEIEQRFAALRKQIATTKTGAEYAATLGRHVREVNLLINQNPRVGATWRRNGGPIILQRTLQAIRDPDCPLPADVLGEPWELRLTKIAAGLRRYASPELNGEFERDLWPFILKLGGKSLDDVLALAEAVDRQRNETRHSPWQPEL